MADDPIVASAVTVRNLPCGIRHVSGLATGGADYDATGGMIFDLSAYGDFVVYGTMVLNPYNETSAVVRANYISSAEAATTGYVHISWLPAVGGAGSSAGVFEEITDTTNLSTYKWHFSCFMYGATA